MQHASCKLQIDRCAARARAVSVACHDVRGHACNARSAAAAGAQKHYEFPRGCALCNAVIRAHRAPYCGYSGAHYAYTVQACKDAQLIVAADCTVQHSGVTHSQLRRDAMPITPKPTQIRVPRSTRPGRCVPAMTRPHGATRARRGRARSGSARRAALAPSLSPPARLSRVVRARSAYSVPLVQSEPCNSSQYGWPRPKHENGRAAHP